MKRILASMAGLMGLTALAGQGALVEVDRAPDPVPAPAVVSRQVRRQMARLAAKGRSV